MIDQLIDFILNIIDQLIPVKILKEYEQGVLFRFGRFKKTLNAGFHFKIPFLDDIDSYPVVYTTITLPPQSLVTKDGISVVIRCHIKYKIDNIRTFAVDVYDAIDALSDMTGGVIFEEIKSKTWEEAYSSDLTSILTKKSRTESKKWGIFIEKVTVTDFSKMNSLRLFNGEVLK